MSHCHPADTHHGSISTPSPAPYGNIEEDAWLITPGTENRTDLGAECPSETYYVVTGSSLTVGA